MRIAGMVALLLLAAGPSRADSTTFSPNAAAARRVLGNAILSATNPPLMLRVDKKLAYVGSLTFRLQQFAEVERFVFARRDKDRARALFIAQFESLLPAAKSNYSFGLENPTRLGAHDYQTQVGFFNFAQAAAARPGFEADRTRAFLAAHGVTVGDDDFLVARYARITDDTKRHELILFYLENVRNLRVTRADLEPGGRREAEAERFYRDVAARARRAFTVVDGRP
jgi:hypothetical protein